MTAYKKLTYSPWGEIQTQEEIAEGIICVACGVARDVRRVLREGAA
jgi:hypothetical protein